MITPPRLLSRFIAWLAVDPDTSHLLGDLHEGYVDRHEAHGRLAANAWYARQAAVLAFGLALPRLRSGLAPSAFVRDVLFAVRSLRRAPGVLIASVFTLAIGIAGPTTMFGIVDAMFTKLPVERPHEVIAIDVVDPTEGDPVGVTLPVFEAWQASSTNLVALGAHRSDDVAVSSTDFAPTRAQVAWVTPDVLTLNGVAPVVGRLLEEADEALSAQTVAVIGEELWDRWFGRSADALGAAIRVDGTFHTVVGVAPSGFGFPHSAQLWMPLRPHLDPDRWVSVVGRLEPGASLSAVRAELDGVLMGLAASGRPELGTQRVAADEFVMAFHTREVRSLLNWLNVVISFLVVIAAANVASLFLARGAARSSEVAVRLAIGAGRVRIARQLAMEALVVAAVGAVLGVGLSQIATNWFATTLESRGVVPYWADFGLRPSLIVFATGMLVAATLIAGVLPALRSSRVDLSTVLKSSGPRGGGRIRVLPWLVGAEVALSCILLILSGLIVKMALGTVQLVGSFPLDDVMTGRVVLEEYDYPAPDDRARFYDQLLVRLDAQADVAAFTVATAMPGDGTARYPVMPAGTAYDRDEDRPRIQVRMVEPAFFEMFGMDVVAGRALTRADAAADRPAVVVNEAYAREHLPGGAVGSRLKIEIERGEPLEHDVVGVVTDPGVSVDDGRRVAAVFVSVRHVLPESAIVAVKARQGLSRAREVMVAGLQAIDADLPVQNVMTLEAIVRRENDGGRIFGTLFGALGLAALLLALVGLHGVVAFTTQQRTREIGVMRALGAHEVGVVWSTTLRGLRPVLIGLVLGFTAAWLASPMLADAFFESDVRDPWIYLGVPLVLLLGAVSAVLLPARRATRINPVSALRAE